MNSKYYTIYILTIVLLAFSLTLNFVLTKKVINMKTSINTAQNFVSETELKNIKNEIDRLSKQKYSYTGLHKYDVKTKQLIINDLIP